MYQVAVAYLTGLLLVRAVDMVEPGHQYFETCQISLIKEEYMNAETPAREFYTKTAEVETLYLSHIKNLTPLWCTTFQKSEFFFVFGFQTTMFITGFASQAEPERYFREATLSHTSDLLQTFGTNMDFDDYIEDKLTGEPKVFSIGAENQTHRLMYPFSAKSIKFVLMEGEPEPCIRLDVLGCFASKLYCADDTATFGGHCYSGISRPDFTQSEADEKCREQESELLIVDSYAEAQFLEGLIPKGYWLGLRRTESLTFHYEHDLGTPSYYFWSGKPEVDNPKYYHEYVAYMTSTTYKWRETKDTNVEDSFGFFCAGEPDENGVCSQPNSTLRDDYCYSFFNTSFVPYDLAYYHCWSKGMWIGIIPNAAGQYHMKSILPSTPWTGITKNEQGNFTYANNTLPLIEKNWNFWTTNTQTGLNEPGIYEYEIDCVIVDGSKGTENNWKDVLCNDAYSVVCQQQKINNNSSCADGWNDLLGDEFCYLNLADQLAFNFATSVCDQLEGELLTFYENDTCQRFSEKVSKWNMSWIGDTGAMMQPLNVSSTLTTDSLQIDGFYSNWSPSQDLQNFSHACAATAGTQGKWNLIDCDKKLLYLCERDPGLQITTPLANINPISADVVWTAVTTEVIILADDIPTGYDIIGSVQCSNDTADILDVQTVTNVSACLTSCDVNSECMLATFSQQTGTCWLLSSCFAFIERSAVTSFGKTVHSEMAGYQMYPNTDCQSHDIVNMNFTSIDECANQCDVQADCVGFIVYNLVCYLKDVCESFDRRVPMAMYLQITEQETVTIPNVHCLWPLDLEFHGLELTEQCEHADLVFAATSLSHSEQFLPLKGEYNERIEVPIPAFLMEPVSGFSLLLSVRWNNQQSMIGTVFGFGNIMQFSSVPRVYSFGVSLSESSQNTSTTSILVSTDELSLRSEEMHVEENTWYDLGISFRSGVLALYFNGVFIIVHDTGTDGFFSELLTDSSQIFIGSEHQMDVHCLQIYTEALSVGAILVAHHRCSVGVSNSKVRTVNICRGIPNVLSCGIGSTISIIRAKYGVNEPYSTDECGGSPESGVLTYHCMVDVKSQVHRICQGQPRCIVIPSGSSLGLSEDDFSCEISTYIYRHLQIQYTCETIVPCEDGWHYGTDKCYSWSNEPKTWANASEECQLKNARLPLINSSATQTAINELLFYKQWVTLSDHHEEGVFKWPDGRKENETHWLEGYPHQQYMVENCTQLKYEGDQLSHNDVMCKYKKSYMCKKRYQANICNKYELRPGEAIQTGERLCSEDGRYAVVLQSDGNLVVKDEDKVTFATGTTSAISLFMSNEGALVLMSGNEDRMISEEGGAYARITPRGYLAIYSHFDNILWTVNNEDCYRTWYGLDYVGHRDVLSSGVPCKEWTNDTGTYITNMETNFPDESLEEAKSFCRNPWQKSETGCFPPYISSVEKTDWANCDIPFCGEGLDGFSYEEENCLSIFDKMNASEVIFYEPGYEHFNVRPTLAADSLVDTVMIADVQKGGACLQDTADTSFPGSLMIVFPETQHIAGLVVEKADTPSNPLSAGLDVFYSSDGMNWKEFVDADLSSSVGPYSHGRHIFSQPLQTKYLKLTPHQRETHQCFRFDLLTCNANILYKEIAVQYRTAIYNTFLTNVPSELLKATGDNKTFMFPNINNPFIYISLPSEEYVLAVQVVYPEQDDLHGKEYKIFLTKDEPGPDTYGSDDELCTEVVIQDTDEHFRCDKFRSTRFVMFQATGYTSLAFDKIVLYTAQDQNALDSLYNDTVDSSPQMSYSDDVVLPEMEYINTLNIGDMAEIEYYTVMGNEWTIRIYKTKLVSGFLNDGLLNGHCLHLEHQHLPTLYIELEQGMYIGEIRITSAADEPFEYLKNLSVSLESDYDLEIRLSKIHSDGDALIGYKDGNCVPNSEPLTPGGTRSYFCQSAVLTHMVLIYKNAEDSLRVCEVELFRDSDKTDIPVPTWESEWTMIKQLKKTEVYKHDLQVTPVYGRILLKTALGGTNDVYVVDSAISEHLVDKFGLIGMLYLSYNENHYLLSVNDDWKDSYACVSELWTATGCLIPDKDLLIKVQLWTSCGFPRPSFMSPWESYKEQDNIIMPHKLGNSLAFGYMQVEYYAEIEDKTSQKFIRQILGSSLNSSSVENENLGMIFNNNTIMLDINENVLHYRALLWFKLGKAPAVYQETFPINDFVGPEKLKLPPFATERSIITAMITVKSGNDTLNLMAPYVGFGGLVFAFNSQYLKLIWLYDLQPTNTQNYTLTSVTVTVYRFGAAVPDGALCEPYTNVQTNLFLTCGNSLGAVAFCEPIGLEDSVMSYTVNCSAETGNWTDEYCTETNQDAEVLHFSEMSSFKDGYMYGLFHELLTYNEGLTLCDEHQSKMIFMTSVPQLKAGIEALNLTGSDQREFYFDAVEMLPFAEVFNIEDVINQVTRHNTSFSQARNETFNYHNDSMLNEDKCLVLRVNGQENYTFEAASCSQNRTVVCRKSACHDRNKFSFIPYLYRKNLDQTMVPYEVATVPSGCLSYCFDRFQCKSMEYNSITQTCSLYDQYISIERDPNGTDFYGDSAIYRKECKKGYDPPWEVIHALNLTMIQNDPISIFQYWVDMNTTDDEDIYPYGLHNRVYLKTKRNHMNYIYQMKISLMSDDGEMAFVSLPTFGRGLSFKKLPYDKLMVSSSNLYLNSSDMYPRFMFSRCKPSDEDLANRHLIVYEAEFCSENGTVLTEYPLSPKALYRDNRNGTLLSSDVMVLSANSFCWRRLSAGNILITALSESHNVRVSNTNFFQFGFIGGCINAQLYLYDKTKPWNYDCYKIQFMEGNAYKIVVYDKGTVSVVQNFKNDSVQCTDETYWIRWIAGLIEIGVADSNNASNTVVTYQTGTDIDTNEIAVYNAEIEIPEETRCPPLVFANTTEKVIRPSEGTCERQIQCMIGYETERGLEEYYTECLYDGHWTLIKDCQKKQCNETTFPNSNLYNVTAYFQDNFTVVCDEDHFAFGNANISNYTTFCNESSQFSPFEPCLRLPCYALTVEDSNASSIIAKYQDEVLVQCHEGFEIESGVHSFFTQCLSNRSWSTHHTCQRMTCPVLDLPNTNVTNITGVFEDRVTALCNLGYALNESCYDGVIGTNGSVDCSYRFTAECEGDSWFIPNTCQTIPCYPVTVANSNSSGAVIEGFFSDQVMVECDTGYEVTGTDQNSFVMECHGNRTWSPQLSCSKVTCEGLQGDNMWFPQTAALFNDIINGSCQDGYATACFVGDIVICSGIVKAQCHFNKAFIVTGTCNRVPCIHLSIDGTNASDITTAVFGDVIGVFCLEGYWINESSPTFYNTECTETGTWTISDPCVLKPCLPLTIENSNASSLMAVYNETVHVACDEGFQFSNGTSSHLLTCLSDRSWDSDAFACYPKPCPTLAIDNSDASEVNGSFGDYFNVRCDYGYEGSIDNSSIFISTCDDTGQWNTMQDCIRVKCHNPVVQPSVEMVNATTAYFVYEEKILYQCRPGYSAIQGNLGPWSMCDGNGQWTSPPICHVDCAVDFVSVIQPASLATAAVNISYGENLMVECPVGQKPFQKILYCIAEGQWNISNATCVDLDCGTPPATQGTEIVWAASYYNATAVYSCAAGFSELEGSNTSVCGLDEQWTEPAKCYRDCPPLPFQEYGHYSTNVTWYGTLVTITCLNASFYLNSSIHTVQCMDNGSWTDTIANCDFLPVDGVWLSWSPWSECTATCGLQQSTRSRECDPPLHGGQPCEGSASESESCALPPCDADGYWTTWTSWSECTVSCSGGEQARRRVCIGPYGSGVPCDGDDLLSRTCSNIVCPKVSCTPPPHIEHTVQLGNSQFVDSIVVYLCQTPDMEFEDGTRETYIRCTRFGTWFPANVPQCKSVKCPEQILPSGTFRSTSQRFIYTSVEYTCLPGYQFKDGTDKSSSFCYQDRTWSHDPPECVFKQCDSRVSGRVANQVAQKVDYGQWVMVSCVEGTRLLDGRHERLDECGAGNRVTDICSEKHCPPIPLVSNASVIEFNQSMVTFQCYKGHRFPDGFQLQTIVCSNESKWEPEYIRGCLVITCPPVPDVAQASPNDTNAIYGTYVRLQCVPGYQFEVNLTSVVIECTDTGEWDKQPTQCLEVICGIPPLIGNGSRSYTNVSLDDQAQYTCTEYHRFSNGYNQLNISCTTDSTWENIDKACSLECCEPVPVAAHARSDTVSAVIDTVATITCDHGYMLPGGQHGPQSTLCHRDTKTWTKIPQDCVPVQCPVLTPGDHMVVSTFDHEYKTEVNVSCESGYWFDTDATGNGSSELVPVRITCLYNQTWNDSIEELNCHRLKCPPLFQVAHATVNSSSLYAGDYVTYTCDHGFQFPDIELEQVTIACMDNGLWSQQLDVNCEIKRCPPFTTWDNQIVNTTETLYPTAVQVSCSEDYAFTTVQNASVVVECGADQLWHPEVPSCQHVRNQTEVAPVEAASSRTIGAAIMIPLLCIVAIVVVTDIVTYYHQALALLKTNVYPNLMWLKQHLSVQVAPEFATPGGNLCNSEFEQIEDGTKMSGSWSDFSRPLSGISKGSGASQRPGTPLSAGAIRLQGLTAASLDCIKECVTPEIGLKSQETGTKSGDPEVILTNMNELTETDVSDIPSNVETSFVQAILGDTFAKYQPDQVSEELVMPEIHQEDEPTSVEIGQNDLAECHSPLQQPPTSVDNHKLAGPGQQLDAPSSFAEPESVSVFGDPETLQAEDLTPESQSMDIASDQIDDEDSFTYDSDDFSESMEGQDLEEVEQSDFESLEDSYNSEDFDSESEEDIYDSDDDELIDPESVEENLGSDIDLMHPETVDVNDDLEQVESADPESIDVNNQSESTEPKEEESLEDNNDLEDPEPNEPESVEGNIDSEDVEPAGPVSVELNASNSDVEALPNSFTGFNDPESVGITENVRSPSGGADADGNNDPLSRASSGYNSAQGSYMEEQEF